MSDHVVRFDLEDDWPSISSHIRMMLARCGVAAALRDDLVQETGLRLLELKASIDPSRSVRAFANTIALNLLRDHLRNERRLVSSIDLSRFKDPANVEREVIARDELSRVSAAIARLSPQRRAVLLAEIGAAAVPTMRSVTAIRMLRMRARKQLTTMLEEVSRAKAVCGITLQRAWESTTRIIRTSTPGSREQIAQVGSAAIAVLTVSVLGVHGLSTTPNRPTENKGQPPAHTAISLDPSALSQIQSDYPPTALSATNTETAKRLVKKPIHRLSLGPLGYVEGEDDEAIGILAKTLSGVTDVVDRDGRLLGVNKQGCTLGSIVCGPSSSARGQAQRSR